MCLPKKNLSHYFLLISLFSLSCSGYHVNSSPRCWKSCELSTSNGINSPKTRIVQGLSLQKLKLKAISRISRKSFALNMNLASDTANGIGFVIGAGSVLLYTPMIYRVIRRRSADGLSASTWLMKLFCYSFNGAYNIYHEYPLSSYSETIAMWVQACLMLFLVCSLQRQWWPIAAAALLPVGITLATTSSEITDDRSGSAALWLSAGQVAASAMGSGAVIPQIVLNARRGSSGEFSAVTASLLTAGNALRAWTTLTLTHDPILLAGFGAGVRRFPNAHSTRL
jgi:hypothetical protein